MKAVANAGRRHIQHELAGDPGAPVVAFANSLGTTSAMWDAQWGVVRPGWRRLRYDMRGHGGTPVIPGPATIDDLADDFAALLDALDIDRVHLAGLSLGGMMGQAFATRHPTRLRSLTLIATTADTPHPEPWATRAAAVREHGMAAIADSVLDRWFTVGFRQAHGPALQTNARRLLETPPEGYACCCDIIAGLDRRQANRAIRTPTLIVAGSCDPATPPAMSEALQQQISGSRLLVVPDAAHLLAVEQPAILNAALDAFLGRSEEDQSGKAGRVSS